MILDTNIHEKHIKIKIGKQIFNDMVYDIIITKYNWQNLKLFFTGKEIIMLLKIDKHF